MELTAFKIVVLQGFSWVRVNEQLNTGSSSLINVRGRGTGATESRRLFSAKTAQTTANSPQPLQISEPDKSTSC